jgi:predicted metal-dependent hydrolase
MTRSFSDNDMSLDYSIIYSKRKTLRITVERDRSVIVRAPIGASADQIQELVDQKSFWLYEKMRHGQKYSSQPQTKEFISGESFPYLGQAYSLNVMSEEFDGLLFDTKFLMSKHSQRHASELFKSWYIERANAVIIPKVVAYGASTGAKFRSVRISDLKYRWGSCTPKNNLNFNWRLIKAPMRVIEYVIVHELAHL